MKLQIQQQSLRFRIDEDELARLLEHGVCASTTWLGNSRSIAQTLQLIDAAPATLEVGDGCITARLPREDFAAFAAERPRRDGFVFEVDAGAHAPLQVCVEIDVRDSRRKGLQRAGGGDPGST